MNATQLLAGQGGWPNSVFLTPDLKPFYAGTYFAPDARFGRPGFPDVLTAVSEAYRQKREEVTRVAGEVAERIRQMAAISPSSKAVGPALLQRAFGKMAGRFDNVEGGFGGAPKFPHSMEIVFLLRYHGRTGNPEALRMAVHSLEKMARGGIYDQIGGGFHRYSVDERWLVPHFEKMLYDNALLARAYLDAWQVTKEPAFARVVEETLGFVQREITAPDGGFYSSLDADSEGEEGRFYVWTPKEIEAVLGSEQGAALAR